MTSPARVLIVDDFRAWLNFVHKMLEKVPNLQIVGVASDGKEAITQAQLLRPDVVLMDMSLPLLNGIESARQIIRLVPETRIIFVSQQSDPALVQAAITAGGRGYVVKLDVCRELLPAIEAVVEGQRYFSSGLLELDLALSTVM